MRWIVLVMLVVGLGCVGDDDTQEPDPCMGHGTVCTSVFDLNVCEDGSTIQILDCQVWCQEQEGMHYYTGSCAPDPIMPEVFSYCACLGS